MKSETTKIRKTLVVCAMCFPPVLIGPAVLMGNLFKHFPKGSYHVLMGRLDHIWASLDKASTLPVPYAFSRFPLLTKGRGWRRIYFPLRDLAVIMEIVFKGIKIIRKEKMERIFAISDHYVELAALIMSWLTGKKIVLWLPDLYFQPDSERSVWTQLIDRMIEPFLLRAVDTVLVTGEPTQEYYKKKYGFNTEVLPHSVDLSMYTGLPQQTFHNKKVTNILYTGMVTICQQGGILDMIKVVNEFPELDATFSIFSNISSKHLKEMGVIGGTRVVCSQANRDDIPALQCSADILFLPLSFKEHGYHSRTVIRTASPSKLPEYLAAGRPILVYAPADSYYAKYAWQEGFGLVVDKPDCGLLRKAIFDLQHDTALCQRLVENARRVAIKYHDAVKLSARLQQFL